MVKKAKTGKTEKPAKAESKKLTPEEFAKKVFELAGKGLTSEKIGEHLRREGIHPKEHGHKISKILKSKNAYTDPELKNTETKLAKIKTHYDKNHQDRRSMRERERIFAKLRKIKKYHGLLEA